MSGGHLALVGGLCLAALGGEIVAAVCALRGRFPHAWLWSLGSYATCLAAIMVSAHG